MSNISLPETVCSVPEALRFWAERTPEAPALVVPGNQVVTYGDLWRMAGTLAASLNQAGLGRGDRVVTLVPEGPELAIALVGTMAAAIAIPLNAGLPAAELSAALDGLDAAAAIVTTPLPASSEACLARLGVPVCRLHFDGDPHELSMSGDTGRPPQGGSWPRPEDIAAVLVTSGTTGTAKRVPNRHGEIITTGRARRDRFGLEEGDRALAVAPLTVSLGLCALFHSIVSGAALILPPGPDLPTLWTTIEAERPTWMFPAAGFLEMLARFLRQQPGLRPPSSLRFIRVTAAPIAPELCAELEERLGAPVLPSYSATETGLIATALPPPAPHKPGSVGVPILELRVTGGDGSSVAPGIPGEIWVRGAKAFAGYLDDPEMDAAVLRPGGWVRTGDTGYLDEDGFLFLTGRLSELINRGGAKIAPAEVDAALLAHPAVDAAAVFAVPDALLGEDLIAAVVLQDGQSASSRQLRAWMLARLSRHKAPRRIWFVRELPCTELGKVQRGELTRLWQAQLGQRG